MLFDRESGVSHVSWDPRLGLCLFRIVFIIVKRDTMLKNIFRYLRRIARQYLSLVDDGGCFRMLLNAAVTNRQIFDS